MYELLQFELQIEFQFFNRINLYLLIFNKLVFLKILSDRFFDIKERRKKSNSIPIYGRAAPC